MKKINQILNQFKFKKLKMNINHEKNIESNQKILNNEERVNPFKDVNKDEQ